MVLIYTRLHFYVLSFNNHCHLLLFAKYFNTYHSIDCCKVHNNNNNNNNNQLPDGKVLIFTKLEQKVHIIFIHKSSRLQIFFKFT